VKINNLDTYCEWVEEGRTTKQNETFDILLLKAKVSELPHLTVTPNISADCDLINKSW
jgi:hypothetical protein